MLPAGLPDVGEDVVIGPGKGRGAKIINIGNRFEARGIAPSFPLRFARDGRGVKEF